MCTGMEMMAAGQLASGLGSLAGGIAANDQAKGQAAVETAVGQVQAGRILRETRRRVGTARAATAASGVKLDEFSTIPERDIDAAGEADAIMTMLGARNRADSARAEGRAAMLSGITKMAGTVFEADFSGWKGRKGGVVLGSQSDGFTTNPFAGI